MKTFNTIVGCALTAALCVFALAAQADVAYIDVMFALDKKAVTYLNDEKEGTTPAQYMSARLTEMNQVLVNSGLDDKFQFRSVGVYELGFEAKQVDSSKELTRDVLENATGGKGMWEDLHTERDNRGADVVSVIIDTGSEYGHVGDGNALTSIADASTFGKNAYSVVSVRSTFDYYAILHEIAHNMGAGHAAEVGAGSHVTDYAYGYYFAGNTKSYYTIMGYPKTGYSPAPIFSTPDETYDGVAAGTSTKDNVRVLEQTFLAASQWRSLPAKAHPAMSVSWNQSSPMNDFAAMAQKDGSWQKAPCGCPATAAAQMLKHYVWPMRTDSSFTGATQRYIDNTAEAFPIRFDGHNDFQWAKMQNRASDNDVVGNFETARLTMWCGAMGGTDYRVGDSSAQFDDIAESASELFQKGKSTYFFSDGAEAVWKAITNALDRSELVQVTLKGHQVVADDYRLTSGDLEVHLNYGWAGSQTGWYTRTQLSDQYSGILYVWTGFAPKKMAQLKPLAKQVTSTGTIPLSWALPQMYANDLTGFMIMAYYPGDSVVNSYAGDTGTIAADRAGTYTLTGIYKLTNESSLSCTLSSYHTSGIKAELQARYDAGEWVTIATPELSTEEDVYDKGELVSSGWLATPIAVNLSSHAGETAEFRFKISRTAKTRTKDGQIFFSKPTWTKVYQPVSQQLGLQGYPDLRSYPLSASGYAGKVVSFTIEPIMSDSVVGEPVATKVVTTAVPDQPAIVSLDSMSSEITDGFQRTCGIGKSVFFVKANETTTAVTAAPSHLALVPDSKVSCTSVGDHTWAVTIDAEGTPVESQIILTLIAQDALGNKSYKDLQLTFRSGEGGAEPEDTLAGKIAAGNFLYVPSEASETLPLDDTRFVAGKGTVTFDGGMPSQGPDRGFNYQDSWKGLVKFINFTPTATDLLRINYEFVNVNSEVQIGGDPEPDPNQMYHNTLCASNEEVKVVRGTYGTAIEVPPVGYYATAFNAKTTLETSGTGIGGSYADIIIKNGGDNDTRQHTFAGWFCASDLSAERILWFAYANDGIQRADNGYKVCVTTEGKIKIVKTSMDAQDNGSAIYSEDAVMSAGKWAHIAVAFSWGGGGQGNRWLKPTLFVNGVQQALTGGTTIGSNLNGDTGAIVQIGADVTAAGVYVDKTTISEGAKVVSLATNACYVVKGKEIMPEPPVPGVDLYWNGNAWTNAAGTVVTPVAESVLHTKEGDVVPYTSAVVGTFDGAGTVKLSNANASTSSALSKWVTNGNFSATFSGALWLAKGRFEANSPVSQNVTIKVTDGAQLSANGSEWSNHFVLSGDGWDGEAHYDFSHCALRVEAPLGSASTLEFVKEGDVVPAIGAYNAERNIKATLVGEDGFRVMGGGTMKFTEPMTQAASLKGTVEIVRGTAQFGNGSAGDTTTEFRFGDKVTVNGQATFILHTRTDSVVDVRTDNKAKFATAIDLNGGTFRMEDGSYVFTKDVSVLADSTMVFKWRKGRVFQSLKGDAVLTVQGTCNPNASEADGYAVFAGGDFSGTIRSTANATKAVNLYVVPLGEALKAATVDLVAQGKLRLTEDATIGALSGTKPIAVTNAGDVHTLTLANDLTLSADTANAALVSDVNLVLDGAAITLKNYDAAACYLATAPTISAKGTTLDPVGWKLTLGRDGKQDVLKAVPLAPFLFFIK